MLLINSLWCYSLPLYALQLSSLWAVVREEEAVCKGPLLLYQRHKQKSKTKLAIISPQLFMTVQLCQYNCMYLLSVFTLHVHACSDMPWMCALFTVATILFVYSCCDEWRLVHRTWSWRSSQSCAAKFPGLYHYTSRTSVKTEIQNTHPMFLHGPISGHNIIEISFVDVGRSRCGSHSSPGPSWLPSGVGRGHIQAAVQPKTAVLILACHLWP